MKEYLISHRLHVSLQRISRFAFEATESHGTLGQKCSAYFFLFIRRQEVQTWIDEEVMPKAGPARRDSPRVSAFTSAYPLLLYVCDFWPWHQRLAERQRGPLPEHQRLHIDLLGDERARAAWLNVERGIMGHIPVELFPLILRKFATVAARFIGPLFLDLRETSSLLYKSQATSGINQIAGHYGFPLQAAASQGHNEIVDLLITNGTRADLQGGYFGTALQAAVYRGHRSMVSKLLRAALECVHSTAGECGTALEMAVKKRDKDYVRDLLQVGADPNSSAIEELVQGPIRLGSEPETSIKEGTNKAPHQARATATRIVESLIGAGATIDLSLELLLAAMKCESYTLFPMLLRSANVEDSVIYKGLLEAIKCAHQLNIQTLVEVGARLNRSRLVHSSVAELIYCDTQSGKAVADLLLELGLEIAGDHHLLNAAIHTGSNTLAKSLLMDGADVYGHSNYSGNALMTALGCGNEVLVESLLDTFVELDEEHTIFAS